MSPGPPPPPAPAPSAVAPPAVILVRPQRQGNVGAAARAMANMGLEDLVLVEPAVALGGEARAFAVKAEGVLDKARRVAGLEQALAPFARVVGTTSSRERDLPGRILTPRQLAAELLAEGSAPTALVFGPEASGLTREELALCGRLVRIPAASTQPTLNLAQAVLVLAYELYIAGEGEAASDSGPDADHLPASSTELSGLFRQVEPLLRAVGFARDDTFSGVLRDLRALAARSSATRREVAILRGICRRTARAVERRRPDA